MRGIFFFLLPILVSAQLFPCQQQNAILNQGEFQYTCCTQGTQLVNVPTGCIRNGGQVIPVNGTFPEVNSQGMGFTYICEQTSSSMLIYHAAGCITNYNNVHSFNDVFTIGNFQYTCVRDQNNYAEVKPIGCRVQDGSYISVGGVFNHCSQMNNNQCVTSSNFQCYLDNNQIFYNCQNCNIGGQLVNNGGNCLYNQQQCSCRNSGVHCANQG